MAFSVRRAVSSAVRVSSVAARTLTTAALPLRASVRASAAAPVAVRASAPLFTVAPVRLFSTAEKPAEGAEKAEEIQEVTVEQLEAVLDSERAALAAAKTRNAELTKQIEQLKQAVTKAELGATEMKNKAKELQERVVAEIAEQDNIRERASKDVAAAKKFGISSFCKSLLEVADTVDMAIAAGQKQLAADENNEALRKMLDGVSMTQATFAKVLGGQGVVKYESIGQQADPNLHEVTAQLPDPSKAPGTISFIIKEGYTIQDRVLRPAQVCIVAAPQ